MTHTKPTPEELQANIDRAQEELAKLETKEEVETEEQTEEIPPSQPAEEVPKDVPVEDIPEEKAPDGEEERQEVTEDYKKRYTESTREAQILYAQNKKKEEAIQAAADLPEPTETDLKIEAIKQGFQFDDMTDIEKALFRQSVHANKKLEKITTITQEGKDVIEWNKKVDDFIEDPKTLIKYTDLEGKTEEFKQFASRATRRGLDFNDLISAFLYETEKARPKHKGKMFETGTGGPNDKPKPKDDTISAMEGRKLMKTNYKLYTQKLKEGKIRNE